MKFKQEITLKEHKAAVYALCRGSEEHIIFSGGSDQYVIQWNLKSMTAEKVVAKSSTTLISLLYIKEYNYLLIGQIEGGIHVIDLDQGKEVSYLKIHKGYIFDLKFHEVKKELVVASGDGSISIWSLSDFKLLYQLPLCKEKIRSISFSPDSQKAAFACGDGSVNVLNIHDWSVDQKIEGFSSAINSVHYMPNGTHLLLGEKNAHLYLVNGITALKELDLAAHYWAIYDIQFSPSKNLFATGSRDKTVKIWDVENMKVLKRFEGLKDKAHTHSVNKLLWLNYNNYLISTGDDGTLKVWSIEE